MAPPLRFVSAFRLLARRGLGRLVCCTQRELRALELRNVFMHHHETCGTSLAEARHTTQVPLSGGGRLAGILDFTLAVLTAHQRSQTGRKCPGLIHVFACSLLTHCQIIGTLVGTSWIRAIGDCKLTPSLIHRDDRSRLVQDTDMLWKRIKCRVYKAF